MALARNVLPNGCSGKRQYSTKLAAVKASVSLNKRAGGAAAQAYFCACCNAFHIGRKGGRDADPLGDVGALERQVARLMDAWNAAGPDARQEFLFRIDQSIMDWQFA